MLCDTWNWSDDNDIVSGIAILDTTVIPEMHSAISLSMFVSVVSSAAIMQKIWNRIVLVDCCLRTHCCTVIIVIFCNFTIRFSITGLQRACCYLLSGTSCTVSSILARLALSHGILYCYSATIYRGIPWPWRYWYRHVGIDDKYRCIVGIAQLYVTDCFSSARRH